MVGVALCASVGRGSASCCCRCAAAVTLGETSGVGSPERLTASGLAVVWRCDWVLRATMASGEVCFEAAGASAVATWAAGVACGWFIWRLRVGWAEVSAIGLRSVVARASFCASVGEGVVASSCGPRRFISLAACCRCTSASAGFTSAVCDF